ncbi:GntR family transcriptional regulator [Rhodococcus sp. HNM0569]|uniref:GntR family transcriptional regulator n=1 Tax=Rhodococcus sp. HNM0569 TaxID=2716340 RepID=UPI001F0DE509|nr:GntR family transcriptional regulator [Rhodococcus sp. HNM0569]
MTLYAQVEAALADMIGTHYEVGDRLPSESELTRQFDVSRITVRRAIANLAARGLVDVRHGTGTFVAPPAVTQPLTALTGFVEDMHALGLDATAEVVDVRAVSAPRDVAAALSVAAGSEVFFIERVRRAAGRALSFDQTYLVADLGRRVAQDDLAQTPIFTLLEDKYGVPLVDATYRMRATLADETVAAALDTTVGDAVFRIERTTSTTNGRPVDHEILHYRGDAVTFETTLHRPGMPAERRRP